MCASFSRALALAFGLTAANAQSPPPADPLKTHSAVATVNGRSSTRHGLDGHAIQAMRSPETLTKFRTPPPRNPKARGTPSATSSTANSHQRFQRPDPDRLRGRRRSIERLIVRDSASSRRGLPAQREERASWPPGPAPGDADHCRDRGEATKIALSDPAKATYRRREADFAAQYEFSPCHSQLRLVRPACSRTPSSARWPSTCAADWSMVPISATKPRLTPRTRPRGWDWGSFHRSASAAPLARVPFAPLKQSVPLRLHGHCTSLGRRAETGKLSTQQLIHCSTRRCWRSRGWRWRVAHGWRMTPIAFRNSRCAAAIDR